MSAAPADPGMKARMAMKPRQAASTAVGRRCRRTELPVVSSTQYLLRAPAGLAVGLAPKEWRYAGCDSPLSSGSPAPLRDSAVSRRATLANAMQPPPG